MTFQWVRQGPREPRPKPLQLPSTQPTVELSQELRPSFESGKALARIAGRLDYFYYWPRFSVEGLRNLGKFSRGLPKLIWDLHTNFTEIKMQEIRVQRNDNPNIPNKKNPF